MVVLVVGWGVVLVVVFAVVVARHYYDKENHQQDHQSITRPTKTNTRTHQSEGPHRDPYAYFQSSYNFNRLMPQPY